MSFALSIITKAILVMSAAGAYPTQLFIHLLRAVPVNYVGIAAVVT